MIDENSTKEEIMERLELCGGVVLYRTSKDYYMRVRNWLWIVWKCKEKIKNDY